MMCFSLLPASCFKRATGIACSRDSRAQGIHLTSRLLHQVSSDETERLIKMEETLHQRVIGQEEAVVAISRAIRRARVGLKNPNRPIASFIFSGPTGVGKSELAKTLASYYFGSEDAMVRLDMSEFMERHTVSKLIGSPPGMHHFGVAYPNSLWLAQAFSWAASSITAPLIVDCVF